MGDPDHMDKSAAYRATLILVHLVLNASRLAPMIPAQASIRTRDAAGLAEWMAGCKPGNDGKDAAGAIAIAWPKAGGPVLICAYTQGGPPTPLQFEAIFAEIGRMAGRQMG
jgi:hypothetical protein